MMQKNLEKEKQYQIDKKEIVESYHEEVNTTINTFLDTLNGSYDEKLSGIVTVKEKVDSILSYIKSAQDSVNSFNSGSTSTNKKVI